MARSYGSAATLLALKESVYGTKPTGNWEKFAFNSSDLSSEQNLIASELLGQGREPRAPFRDVINDTGNLVVPVECRDFGRWLTFLLGNPVSAGVAATGKANGVVSGATLSVGGYTHTWISGSHSLPSFACEIGHANVPAYFVHTGCMLNSMALNFQRSGAANATLNIIAQGETRFTSSQGGTPTSRVYKPFSQFNGSIKRNSVPLANVTGAQFTYTNGMQTVPTIRNDGLIDGVDPTTVNITGSIDVRFADTTLVDDALNNNAIEIELAYKMAGLDGNNFSLTCTFHEVYLPRPRIPISGPGGVQCSFNWQGVYDEAMTKSATFVLKNDIATYP